MTQEPAPLPENTRDAVVSDSTQEQSDNSEETLIIQEIEKQAQPAPLPGSVNHSVIFFPQAPDGDRNLPRQEACEEASIALANYFAKGKSLSKDQMRADIL